MKKFPRTVPMPKEGVRSLPQPVSLVGFGVEGRETLAFLLRHGGSQVQVFDKALQGVQLEKLPGEFPGVRFFGGEDWGQPLSQGGTLIRSPGVRPDHPALLLAARKGARVTSATRLFLDWFPGPVVGVTGTVGKGTTASLVASALEAMGIPHRLGGNIGVNPLSFLADSTPETVAVLELSSFQLMDLDGEKPRVAVVLRTTSEHMDWHRDLSEYRLAKRRMLAPAGEEQDIIFCADSEGSQEIVAPRQTEALAVSLLGPVKNGIGMEQGAPARFRQGVATPLPALGSLAIPGGFNLENAAAALLAVEALTAREVADASLEPAQRAIAKFPGLPHRLEKVGRPGGVICFNDSYATRPDATLGALGAFDTPLTLILGGSEKFADFTLLAEALCRHPTLRRVVLIGTTAQRLATETAAAAARLGMRPPPIVRAKTLEEAFQAGLEGLEPGQVLLFSPACASFDMFPNYKVRGERFKALVDRAAVGK